MDEASTSAILAFYNLLAAKIGLEDCRSLKDVYNLMPILANCMKHGAPVFVDDPNFGYRNAIALIALELDAEFHSQLNSEAAEGGDEFEAAKIHLAMIYTFRLVKTEAFSTICEQLEERHQRNFAYMIERLDDRHRWTFHPWPKLLHSDLQHSDDKDGNKENGGDKAERILFSPSHVARTPKLINTGRKSLFVPSTNSPVKEVVASPRGEEVVRIHALEREVKSLREIRDVFGQEKDRAEEIWQQKERENNTLMKTNDLLKSRLERVLPVAEQLPHLEGQLISMHEQIGSLARTLKEAQTTGANAQERVFNLQFELDELEIKYDELRGEHAQTLKRTDEATEQLEKAREKIRKLEEQGEQYKSKSRELRNRIKKQEEEFNRRFQEKVDEMQLLQLQLQATKSDNETKTAAQGNSLFAEVFDGKVKMEAQLIFLHTENGQLRRENEKLRAQAETAQLLASNSGKTLSGPTLCAFLTLKNEREVLLSEKQSLLERLHAVEELERGHAKQWARECPEQYNIFQENLHTMNMRAKQKAEKRVLELGLREKDLQNELSYERQRAESVPHLEQRVGHLERELARCDGSLLSGGTCK